MPTAFGCERPCSEAADETGTKYPTVTGLEDRVILFVYVLEYNTTQTSGSNCWWLDRKLEQTKDIALGSL